MTEEYNTEELIGQLLAQGFSNSEILVQLVAAEYTRETAVAALRHVYDTWQEDVIQLSPGVTDFLNWHVQQRHQILRGTLSISDYRAALAILDSLAQLQGLAGNQETPLQPLAINLVPKSENKT